MPLTKGNGPDLSQMINVVQKAITKAMQPAQKKGAKIVFVSGGKVYAIKDTKKAENFVGEEVTVTGSITDGVLEITKLVKK